MKTTKEYREEFLQTCGAGGKLVLAQFARNVADDLDEALAQLAAERERRQREGDEADALWQSKLHAALAERDAERAAAKREGVREGCEAAIAELRTALRVPADAWADWLAARGPKGHGRRGSP